MMKSQISIQYVSYLSAFLVDDPILRYELYQAKPLPMSF